MKMLMIIGRAFEIEPDTEAIRDCIYSMQANNRDIGSTWDTLITALSSGAEAEYTDLNGVVLSLGKLDSYLELTRALGDFSRGFKACYTSTELSIYHFWMFVSHYESFTNYLLSLVANILSYAILFNAWIDKIEELDNSEEDKSAELFYAYAVIVRKLFFFEYIPDHLNEDL